MEDEMVKKISMGGGLNRYWRLLVSSPSEYFPETPLKLDERPTLDLHSCRTKWRRKSARRGKNKSCLNEGRKRKLNFIFSPIRYRVLYQCLLYNSFFHDIYELTFEKGKRKENGKEWEQKNKFSVGLDTGRKKNLESK